MTQKSRKRNTNDFFKARSSVDWSVVALAFVERHVGTTPSTEQRDSGSESQDTETSTETTESFNTDSHASYKLTNADKEKVREMFDALDVEKMWQLSSGTKVEEKMKELAMKSNYEQCVILYHYQDKVLTHT